MNFTRLGEISSGRAAAKEGKGHMTATKIKKGDKAGTSSKGKTEPPWNVMLHNDWDNAMPKVVIVLKKTIPGMTVAKATRIMWEAHSSGQAIVKSCHKELAEFYMELLQAENLTVDIEKAG